uniref:hypothetical protein n=1 Tax=Streptococcus suis TaxID=1307 RepID=UPI00370D6217
RIVVRPWCHVSAAASTWLAHLLLFGFSAVAILHALCIESMAACLFWSFIADLVNLIVSICFEWTVVIEICHCLSIEKLQEIANGLS